MSWDATSKSMERRITATSRVLGLVGIAAGAVLFRGAKTRLLGALTIADGIITFATRRGMVPHAWRRGAQLAGNTPNSSQGEQS